MNAAPVIRDVLLVGGGHSHALLLRRWAMRPLPGVRLTLVSRDVMTPYSGMLPGLIAGHYSVDDVHIDLLSLCAWAGARFIRGNMSAIDMVAQSISIDGRPTLNWDVLSLDTGSTPDLSVPGARDHATPVKPVADFHARWQSIRARVQRDTSGQLSLGVVGSGAGGFELIMAMRHALPSSQVNCHWFIRGQRPLSDRPERLGKRALTAARREGVIVHMDFDVASVNVQGVKSRDGLQLNLDEVLWCTGAIGPDWPAAAGLLTDERGFVSTDVYLRSKSHPCIFATGDIGTQRETPSAKAGVFAVRQAPVLHDNIRATLLGEALRVYRPQKDFLSLMATGGKSAIASRGRVVLEGTVMWRWKDHIDGAFMQRFHQLPVMSASAAPDLVPDGLLKTRLPGDERGPAERNPAGGDPTDSDLTGNDLADSVADGSLPAMRCRGCGAKVGGDLLDAALARIAVPSRDDVLSGVAEAEDAAHLNWPHGELIQSVDQLDAIIDDPWRFGRIAALHALSDIHASSARAHSAQLMLTVPRGHRRAVVRDVDAVLDGVLSALDDEYCALIGGHTSEGAGLSIGLVVNAIPDEASRLDPASTKSAQQAGSVMTEAHEARGDKPSAGDAVVLTQAIGIGTLFAGLQQSRVSGLHVEAALERMVQSNRAASEILVAHGATAMTDVTGFGLLGHLERMLRDRSVDAARSPGRAIASIMAAAVPVLPGALDLAEVGVRSSLWESSRRVLDLYDGVEMMTLAWQSLLCDPQTGGGLLATLPASRAVACCEQLRKTGYGDATIIGELINGKQHVLC